MCNVKKKHKNLNQCNRIELDVERDVEPVHVLGRLTKTSQEHHSHARVARLVDDDSLSRLIHIVVHAKVGSHPMQQHSVIRSHLRKLLILVTGGAKRESAHLNTEL